MTLKYSKTELFILNITQIIEINFIMNNKINNMIIDLDLSLIPEEYHEFIDIFSK